MRVRFDGTGAGVDARELLWGPSAFESGLTMSPANLIFSKGGFMEITAADYEWMRGRLAGILAG